MDPHCISVVLSVSEGRYAAFQTHTESATLISTSERRSASGRVCPPSLLKVGLTFIKRVPNYNRMLSFASLTSTHDVMPSTQHTRYNFVYRLLYFVKQYTPLNVISPETTHMTVK